MTGEYGPSEYLSEKEKSEEIPVVTREMTARSIHGFLKLFLPNLSADMNPTDVKRLEELQDRISASTLPFDKSMEIFVHGTSEEKEQADELPVVFSASYHDISAFRDFSFRMGIKTPFQKIYAAYKDAGGKIDAVMEDFDFQVTSEDVIRDKTMAEIFMLRIGEQMWTERMRNLYEKLKLNELKQKLKDQEEDSSKG